MPAANGKSATRTATKAAIKAPTRAASSAVDDAELDPTVNLVVLRGVASAPPETRVLRSGRRLATLSVRVHALGPSATSVPVAVWDPPAWVEALDLDDPVVVVGTLRRRFFQTATGTGSRVEVEASLVGRGNDRRRLDTALRRADEALEGLA
jgi:single-strand DNA-binding protein